MLDTLSFQEKKSGKHDYYFICIDGIGGSGKTVMATALALLSHKNYNTVYSNFNLFNIPNFVKLPRKLNKAIILNLEENSLLLLTEAYLYIDCRESSKKNNREITHALFQARKIGMDIILDIPSFHYADLRFKEWTKLVINARGRKNKNSTIFCYDFCRYQPHYDRLIYLKSNVKRNMKPFFKHYDTKEVIDRIPLLNSFNKEKNQGKLFP